MRFLLLLAALSIVVGCGSEGSQRLASGGRGQEVVEVPAAAEREPGSSEPALTSTTLDLAAPTSASTSAPHSEGDVTSFPAAPGEVMSVDAARDALAGRGDLGLPVPPLVVDCVAAKVATDPAASAELSARAEGKNIERSVVAGYADACMRQQVLVPSIVDGISEQMQGKLAQDQGQCVAESLLAADPAVIDDVIADALTGGQNPGRAPELASLLSACGVEVGR